MLESDSPEAVFAAEPDAEIAATARALWQQHLEAEQKNFLASSAMDVHQFLPHETSVFAEDQLLNGRFRIRRLLGRGGMGEVYLAQDELLGETVALKTILAEFASEPTFVAHLVSEVTNARRVTHPNVCRIFDIADDDGVSFFTMEYVAGPTLAEWLSTAPGDPALRRSIALALAHGLLAAHEQGVIHRDFKPANVILGSNSRPVITDFGLARQMANTAAGTPGAGTVRYMAPELREGGAASIASDIFAFGAVLGELLPGHPLALVCQAPEPAQRPPSLATIIDRLSPGNFSRRNLIALTALGAAGAGGAIWSIRRAGYPLASQQRIILNGIRSTVEGETPLALRELLLTALRQSPLLRIVPDVRVRALLLQGKRPGALPAQLADLFAAASLDRIPLILESSVQQIASGLRLAVQLFPAGDSKPALTIAQEASNVGHLVRLAEAVANELRRELGESGGSMKSNLPLEQITSGSPEAVQFYYRAVRAQDKNDLTAALAYLDEALRLDPAFAVAHHYRGVTLVASSRINEAMPSLDRALALSSKLQDRERNWIESQRYMVLKDPQRSLGGCRRNAALYPDEPVYQRQTAAAYARLGQFPEALQFCRRAAELDPFNDNNLSELVVTLAEANRGEEALAAVDEFRRQGNTSTLLDWGAGQALLGLGRYSEATAAFERLGAAASAKRWAALLNTIPLILEGAWSRASQRLEIDLAHDDATQEQLRRHTRRLWLAELALLRDDSAQAATFLRQLLPILEVHAGNLDFFHFAAALAARLGSSSLTLAFLAPLQQFDRQSSSTHSQGAVAHVRGLLDRDTSSLRRAKGLWPHPPILLSCGERELQAGEFASALNTFEELDRCRGKVFKHYFPGIAVLGWRQHGKTLQAMSRFAEASRLYERVQQHWGSSGASGAWQRSFFDDRQQVKQQQGEK